MQKCYKYQYLLSYFMNELISSYYKLPSYIEALFQFNSIFLNISLPFSILSQYFQILFHIYYSIMQALYSLFNNLIFTITVSHQVTLINRAIIELLLQITIMLKIYLTLFVATVSLSTSQNCASRCALCPNFPSCSECQPGFFLINDRECRPCPSNCKTCKLNENNHHPVCQSCSQSSLSQDSMCLECMPSCKECSGTPDNCTSCKSGFILKANGNGSQCLPNPQCNKIAHCSSCLVNSTQVCEMCDKNYFSFRRGCDKCKQPCLNCDIDLQQLWISEVQPFWNQNRTQLFTNINSTSNKTSRLLQDNSRVSNNSNNNFVQNYKNWTLEDWNAATWTKDQLLQYDNMSQLSVKGWTQAYFFFKAAQTKLKTNSTLIDLLYNCLPIVEELLGLTEKNQNQWKHLARFLSTYSNSRWNGPQLEMKVVELAAGKTICLQCPEGLSLSNSTQQCVKCGQNCGSCMNNSCVSCIFGYFLDQSNSCIICDQSCSECDGLSTNCTACSLPLILSGNKCISCTSPCFECNPANITSCITCIGPYSLYPNSSKQCFMCDSQSCSFCNETNITECFECREGFYLKGSSCQACPNNCSYCGQSNSNSVCFLCTHGFALKNGLCVQCSSNCSSCFGQDPKTCKKCGYGRYLNSTTGDCTRCPRGCKNCSSADSCSQFQDGAVIYNDQFVFCQFGCLSCNSSSPSQCLKCFDGFFLLDETCKLCPSNCKTCENSTYCTECVGKGILTAGTCTSCNKACKECNPANTTQCLSCPRGRTLDRDTCIQANCEKGCINCSASNQSICLQCDKGYGLKSNGKCIRCLGRCSGHCNPDNITQCLSCMEGFYVNTGACVRCPDGCSKCTQNGKCSFCVQGYKIDNVAGTCNKVCLFPCATCTTTSCDTCQAGYVKQNGKCVVNISCNPECTTCLSGSQQNPITLNCTRCTSDCSSCSSNVCLSCFDGYYLSPTSTCSACPEICLTCYDNQTCNLCSSGYTKQILSSGSSFQTIVFGSNCIACSSNCKTCSIYKNRCTSCRDGFRLRGLRCVGNYTVIYKYEIDFDFAKFCSNSESENFTKHIAKRFNNDVDRNTIDSIRNGSTVVEGTVSADNQSQANEIQQTLSSNQNIGDYKILSSSVVVAYNDQPVSSSGSTNTKQQYNKTGIVVGSVVAGILILIIIVTLCYCCRKNSENYNEEKQTHPIEASGNKSADYEQKYPGTSQNLKYRDQVF